MAAEQALGAEPDATENAKAFDCFISILRASGLEAAGAGEENGQVRLVAAQEEKRDTNAHGAFSDFRSSAVRTANGAVATLGLG